MGLTRDRVEHDPEKHALGLDPRVGTGFPKRSCSNKKIERDDDSKKSHPALVFVWVQTRCEGNRQQVENLKSHCVQDAGGTKEQTQYCREQHEPDRASDDRTLFSKPMLLNYHVSRLG